MLTLSSLKAVKEPISCATDIDQFLKAYRETDLMFGGTISGRVIKCKIPVVRLSHHLRSVAPHSMV